MDEIRIENLAVYANHGIFPEERKLGQKFIVSAVLYLNLRKAGIRDDIKSSVNYSEACQFIEDFMKNNTYCLIEAAAEKTAEAILEKYRNIDKVRLEIKKPWAPVSQHLETVAVRIERARHRVFLSTGSNLGDSKAYLDDAVKALGSLKYTEVINVSSYMVTDPYGMIDQPEFLNAALEISTLLSPEELLEQIHVIEQKAGRKREVHWGPRTLDIDIIFYDDLVIEDNDLCIPHVYMHNRRFVLEPLCEIAPYKRHPVYGKTVREMLEDLS